MLILTKNDLPVAVEILRNSGIVAVPTETVYGLAANAMDKVAVSKIFRAKGRPQDNPLIVHISDKEQVLSLVLDFPTKAQKLVEKFWPGPLTIILPKSNIVIDEVSAGLDSVAVRLPANQITRDIIRQLGCPLVAPSANRSGTPSPTKLKHVVSDMDWRIDAVVDGGECKLGVESTVISLLDEVPLLLRAGAITSLDIQSVIGEIGISESIAKKTEPFDKPLCPGTKYKHYAPNAKIVVVDSRTDKYLEFVNPRITSGVYALCYEEDLQFINFNALSYGKANDSYDQAKNLFSCLRKLDDLKAKLVYARPPCEDGVGLAVYDRLIRAAGFNVIKL